MKVHSLSDMKAGWFIGDFEPSVLRTKEFEVGVKLHPKESSWDVHYHKLAIEVTLLVSGKMKIAGQVIEAGQVFVIEPHEIADPVFLEDCLVVVVKTPSLTQDKYIVAANNKGDDNSGN